MDRAGDFGQDRERIRIPFEQGLVALHGRAVFGQNACAIHHLIALLLAVLVVHNRDDAVAVHGDQFARLAANGLDADVLGESVELRILRRLLVDSRSGSTDVERTHGELRARLADGLRRDHAYGLAALHQATGRQVAPIAGHANTALRFAGEHRADFDALNAGRLNRRRQLFSNLLIHAYDHVAFIILLIFERDAAHNAVAQRLDDFAGFDDGLDEDALAGSAIVFADDYVLRHVHQTARQVTRIGRLQRGIGQTLTGAVGRDEVLQHVEAFAEIGRDGRFDDLARGLGHQAAHTGKLADLLLGTARAGIGHDVNRIEVAAGAVVLFHGREHLVGDLLGDLAPDFDDLVVALAVGDGAVLILVFHQHHFLFRGANQAGLFAGDHHVVDADGDAGARGVKEAQRFDVVEHVHRDVQAELQIAVLHELAEALLLQEPVDERHILRKRVVQNHAAYRGIHILFHEFDGLGMHDVLRIE